MRGASMAKLESAVGICRKGSRRGGTPSVSARCVRAMVYLASPWIHDMKLNEIVADRKRNDPMEI